MTYVSGFVAAVPEGNKQAYIDLAHRFWELAEEFGALSQVECWEDDVPDGKTTDMRRAVRLEDGEKVVFSWVTWPDKPTYEAAQQKMMEDPRMQNMGEMPFDGSRMISGGFAPIVELGA
ncbi:DUF1428 domain-containing protein [Qipengyuania oceanensis]|uniref:DUF1428 family protein n=1 Tax=Qipengyuania oceanensis TaxID=1463597 RepID=A0A844YIJ2_9SPHN|nr:DUF1428 domain-containing protein [Qipengyuania oceanensis]MXO63563.1 DUF1428 family protein [Qipengyuania oceanensis]